MIEETERRSMHRLWTDRVGEWLRRGGRWVLKGYADEAPHFLPPEGCALPKPQRMADFLLAGASRPMHWADLYVKRAGMVDFMHTGRTYTGANEDRFLDLARLRGLSGADIVLFFLHLDDGVMRMANLADLIASMDCPTTRVITAAGTRVVCWPCDSMAEACSVDDLMQPET